MTANMRKAFLAFLPLIVLLTLSGCNTGGDTEKSDFTVSAADTAPAEAAGETDYAPKEDFDYTVSGGSVRIKKYIGNASVVVIPEKIEGYNITGIDAHFLEGSRVEEITYPSGITDFRGLSRCDNLKTLHLPASIEKMQDSLRFCENLTEIDIEEGGAYKTADGVLYTADMKTLVSYPRGRTGSFIVPDGVESIGIYAFCSSKLSEIVLPDSLKTIEAYAFMNAEELNEAIIPSSVKEIGFSAFSESGIKKVTLSEGVEEINANAFSETRIKELYIPDSVQSCDSGIVDENVYISASYPSEGLKALTRYKNVNFRDETRLEEAFRKAEEIVKKYDNIWFYNGVIFTDITGDAFPEIIALSGSSEIEIYFYSQKGVWQGLYSDATTIGYYRSDLKLHLIYDGENDTYSYYTDVYNARFRGGYGGIVTGDGMYSQCRVSFNEEGMEYTELFNDDVKNLSSEEIIETIDVSGIINSIVYEYGIDLQEQYKKFTVIADGLAEEP
ncbi:MAG: leucine-rich repeat protein, partial [Ruminococcaceae bacterium]|nr:leucine-rich repeat protein [Oscillospiraceae bacterium]